MNENNDDLIINESNFDTYFKDIKQHGPQQGQILARYLAKAELVNGDEKGYLVDLLLTNPIGAEMSVQMAKKLFFAKEIDAVRLCKAIARDLLDGMSRQEVMEKSYSYTLERFYWSHEEYVPKNDPHWSVIKVTMLITDPPEETTEKNEEEQ